MEREPPCSEVGGRALGGGHKETLRVVQVNLSPLHPMPGWVGRTPQGCAIVGYSERTPSGEEASAVLGTAGSVPIPPLAQLADLSSARGLPSPSDPAC